MAIEKLKAAELRAALGVEGRFKRIGDGGGLCLVVKADGRASWVLRYQRDHQRREMGLGSIDVVPLAEARKIARGLRLQLAHGIDPLLARDEERRKIAAARASAVTFRAACEQVLKQRAANGDAAKTLAGWRNVLMRYAVPLIGDVSVADVDRSHVIRVLEPVWNEKPETASRLRQRIEIVLDAAAARGLRDTDNPARLALLKPVLGVQRQRVQHHASLDWRQIPEFMKALAEQEGLGARALEFTILCAARTSEVLCATWDEIDGDTWRVPAERMKAKRDHRVPLSPQARAVLNRLHNIRRPPFVFFGARDGQPLSNMSMLVLLRRMGRTDITPHGFRSSFREWCADNGHDRELAEQALAHRLQGVEAAYQRSDMFDRRRKLMTRWGGFCDGA